MRSYLPKSIAPPFWPLLACLFVFISGSCDNEKPDFILGGGPSGGTFHNFAVEPGELLNQEMPEFQIKIKQTASSVDNLTRVDRGKMDMALVNTEDAYLGKAGQFPKTALIESSIN